MTGAPLWIPAFAGMTKKDQSPCSHGFSSFSKNAPRHSREGGNPLGITVTHIGVLFLNQPNLPCLGPFFQAYLCICIQLANIDTLIFLVRNARGFMLQPTRQWRVIVFPSVMYPFYCSYWLRNRSSLVITVSRSSIRGSVMILR